MTQADSLQKSSLLERSKAVRTFPLFPLPKIELDLTEIKHFNWKSTNIKEWLSPVIDLSEFESSEQSHSEALVILYFYFWGFFF